jgi:holliday junction DNA helicase RuvA
MIRFISGTIQSTNALGIVVLCSGLGYFIRVHKKNSLLPGDPVSLYTHLAVRENALDLYGFLTEPELECFELLLGISKIGPKSAMQILDAADVSLIIESVNLGDAAHLCKLSGITKKTAEKIVTELKDKIETLSFSTSPIVSLPDNSAYNDIFDTLLTLGYNPIAIRRALEDLDLSESTSTLVRHALQKLS